MSFISSLFAIVARFSVGGGRVCCSPSGSPSTTCDVAFRLVASRVEIMSQCPKIESNYAPWHEHVWPYSQQQASPSLPFALWPSSTVPSSWPQRQQPALE